MEKSSRLPGNPTTWCGAYQYGRLSWPWLKALFVFNLDFNMAPWYDDCDPVRYYSVAGQPAFLALGAISKRKCTVFIYLRSESECAVGFDN